MVDGGMRRRHQAALMNPYRAGHRAMPGPAVSSLPLHADKLSALYPNSTRHRNARKAARPVPCLPSPSPAPGGKPDRPVRDTQRRMPACANAPCGARESTLRQVLEYSAGSTRILRGEYCSARRIPSYGFPERHAPGNAPSEHATTDRAGNRNDSRPCPLSRCGPLPRRSWLVSLVKPSEIPASVAPQPQPSLPRTAAK